MDSEITRLLSKNSIFEGLSAEQIEEILPCIVNNLRTYHEDECVYEKGAVVRDLGVVIKGKLKAIGDGGNAAAIEPNGMFGEMVVFSTDGALPHRVVAAEGTQVLFLSGSFFRQVCDKDCNCREAHGEVTGNMLRMLSDKAILLGKKLAYLTAPDLRTKIAMYLCDLYELNGVPQFNMPLNRDRLAEFFSVARPSLSRELINLKAQGLIDFHRSSVEIRDIGKLHTVARGE